MIANTKIEQQSRALVVGFNPQQPDLPRPERNLLGEKAAAVIQMAQMNAPVPPGLIITTACGNAFLEHGNHLPPEADSELATCLAALEQTTGRRLGDSADPLLLSVRASPPFPIPMSIPAVLNVGINKKLATVLGERQGDPRFGWDAYARFVRSFSQTVLGLPAAELEEIQEDVMGRHEAQEDLDLDTEALQELARLYQEQIRHATGAFVPSDPADQLRQVIEAGLRDASRFETRELFAARGYERGVGTAVLVQPMVFGNAPGESFAGRIVSRHPATGEKVAYGRYLSNAQGPDLAASTRLAQPVEKLLEKHPKLQTTLLGWVDAFEREWNDAVEVHFSIEDGDLYLLQCASPRRTGRAGLRIAMDLVEANIADERQALLHLDPSVLNDFLHPILDDTAEKTRFIKGLPASPGSAVGQVVFFAEQAEDLARQGIPTILVRHETTPEDIGGLTQAEGILTATGGLTSHAAVVARGMGKCCIVGATGIEINYHLQEMTVDSQTVRRLDWISLDGNTGEVFLGQLPQIQPTLAGPAATVLKWADAHRRLAVRANADTAEDAKQAVELGAEGIGLCRTEHMFFDIDRIPLFRQMILATDVVGRSAALAALLPLQRKDFMDLFRVMNGRPLTIRLLDPPLHEFLPRGIRSQSRMAKAMGITVDAIQRRTETLRETNPMLGHRGCRLAITYPEIYQMQGRAIVEAACIVHKEGIPVGCEIMVPLVASARELEQLREQIDGLAKQIMNEMNESIEVQVGTMVETPRAAVCAGSIARGADFFSFGTNDLTQMSFGFSRDDAGMFLPTYIEKGILGNDPFVELDQAGVGGLIRMAIEAGRKANPNLKIGICGEHGGDPPSVHFSHALGLDYVSCSPFRIPIARLAAAQAAVMEEEGLL